LARKAGGDMADLKRIAAMRVPTSWETLAR
jgi:hypothetical protein